MTPELLSPELALIDPDLAARARAALPAHPTRVAVAARPPAPVTSSSAPPSHHVGTRHPYPLWARVTAAMWFVVIGILIGGAAIPHAQDTPRLIPKAEDASICTPQRTPAPLGSDVTQPGP